MRVIARSTLNAAIRKYPELKTAVEIWHSKTKAAIWDKPSDVIQSFSKARILNDERIIFNLKKNDFRLIVSVNYERHSVYICFIGTHAEYDKIDPLTVKHC